MKTKLYTLYDVCTGSTVQQEYLLSRTTQDTQLVRFMKSITQQINKTEEKITKIVDQVLKQVFGTEATRLIYKYLESKHSMKEGEIAEKIDVFAKGLEEFLKSGAHVIERKILDDIYSSYGLLRRIELERMQEEQGFVVQVRSLLQKT